MPDSILAAKKPGWFELRFAEDHKKVRSKCAVCERSMWLPESKSARYHTCGSEACKIGFRSKKRADFDIERQRPCLSCSAIFFPKKSQIDDGHGKYCSQQCARDAGACAHLTSAENMAKAAMARKKSIEKNGTKHKRGEESPFWRGGRSAVIERQRVRASSAEGLDRQRAYRKANKDKMREFRVRRRGRSYGRLPSGTVAKIGALQKWLCVVCRDGIKDKYHADHIVPLAKGGLHVAENIQLLCPTCNVRKSAKDPIDFMQSRGFLL